MFDIMVRLEFNLSAYILLDRLLNTPYPRENSCSSISNLKNYQTIVASVTDHYIATTLRKAAECLFFLFYGTQIDENEAEQLANLLRLLSNSIVEQDTLPAPAANSINQTTNTFLSSTSTTTTLLTNTGVGGSLIPFTPGGTTTTTTDDWSTAGYSILAVLQLAHVAALDQFNVLLHRQGGVSGSGPGLGAGIPAGLLTPGVEVTDMGSSTGTGMLNEDDDVNRLQKVYGIDTDGSGSGNNVGNSSLVWHCEGVKGLACLANAVLRQPAVDRGDVGAVEVTRLLIEVGTVTKRRE